MTTAARTSLARDIPLRSLLLLGVLVGGMIPLLVVSLVGYNAARNELKAQAFSQLRSVRDVKIAVLSTFFFERRADIRVFASNPYLGQAYLELSAAGAEARRRIILERYVPFLNSLVREYEYDDLLLLDPESGRIIYSFREPTRPPEAQPGLNDVWRTARAGQPAISDLGPNAAQYLAAPIRSDGRIVGIIAVRVAPQAIESIIRDRSGLGPTGATFLVGPDGRVRAPFPAEGEKGKEPPAAMLVRNWARLAGQASEGERIGPGRSGRTALSSYAPARLPGLTWTLIAEIDESEIDRQIAGALNPKILPILGLSLVLLIALALLISRFVALGVGRVIGELRRLLRDVQDGRLRSRAEVASMSTDFRPVLRGINELVEALERQMEARRRLEEHVRDSQRLEAIGRLAAGIAHDFNNLLAQMQALSHIIEQENEARGSIAPARLEDMKSAIRRGIELVGQILTFSRPGRSQEMVADLRMIAEDTIKIIRAALPPGISVALEPSPDPLPVRGDPAQVHQIVMNLCVNAVQALEHDGGTVSVRLISVPAAAGDGETDMARLTVEDSGPGIPEEIQNRVFEPFFTTKPAGQGSGLGLSIANGIVMTMGGFIRLESAPGRGSRFEVYLPSG